MNSRAGILQSGPCKLLLCFPRCCPHDQHTFKATLARAAHRMLEVTGGSMATIYEAADVDFPAVYAVSCSTGSQNRGMPCLERSDQWGHCTTENFLCTCLASLYRIWACTLC